LATLSKNIDMENKATYLFKIKSNYPRRIFEDLSGLKAGNVQLKK
jgi:hypothetical protein